jgi:hypothetical protein
MSKNVNFEPQGMNFLAKIPSEAFDKQGSIILDKATKEGLRKGWIEGGKPLDVIKTGDGCGFVKEGDSVMCSGRAMMQKIEFEGEAEPYWLMRESDVAGKFTL